MGIRETASFNYGASDFYFGSILFNKTTEIAIEDVMEVKQAQWILLSAITHNGTNPLPKYPLYQGAYTYIQEVQGQVNTFNEGATGCESLQDYLRKRNLSKPA